MEQNYILSSTFPCLVFGDNVFLGEVDASKKLDAKDIQAKQIEVFPRSTFDPIYFIPFAFTLENPPKSDKHHMVFDLLNGVYEIEITPRLETRMSASFEKVFEKQCEDTNICVLWSNVCKIVLENKKHKVEFCPKHILHDIVCKTFTWDNTQYFVLTAKTQSDKTYLFVANTQRINSCIQKVCDDIFFDLPKITTASFVGDHFRHAVISVFKLNPKGLEKVETYSSKSESGFISPPQRENVGRVFFECIKVRDFDLARSLLTQSLSQALSNEHFLHFFPKFDKIKATSLSNVFLLAGEEETYFKLSFTNEKIENIEIYER